MKKQVSSNEGISTGNESSKKIINDHAQSPYNGVSSPTETARRMAYDLAYDLSELSLDKVVHYLDKEFDLRTHSEVFNDAIRERAKKLGISKDELIKELKKEKKSSSWEKSVSSWLSGKHELTKRKRETIIEIAFALKMTPKEANAYLNRCFEDGFYMRDIKDVIYVECLEKGLKYEEACKIIKAYDNSDYDHDEPKKSDLIPNNEYTKYLEEQFANKKNLKEFIGQNKQYFGSFRRKAHERLMEFYNNIKEEFDDISILEDYIVDECVKKEKSTKSNNRMSEEVYDWIVMSIPKIKLKEGTAKKIRDLIVEGISGRDTMSKLVNKTVLEKKGKVEPINRKLLILAYLASEKEEIEMEKYSKEEDELKAFKKHLYKINEVLLKECGMPALDPRNPFDWVILHVLRRAYYEDESIVFIMPELVIKMIEAAEVI